MANGTKIPPVTFRLAMGTIVVWVASWALLWASGEGKRGNDLIFEPAVVGGTLGFVGIAWFAAIYFREDGTGTDQNSSHRLRSAIAGSVVLVFLLLVVDLLTIAGLRESLEGLRGDVGSSNGAGAGSAAARAAESASGSAASVEEAFTFVEGILDTFKWVVITVVGFYFAAGAAEAVGKNVEEKAQTRARADVEIAAANQNAAEAQARAAEATRDAVDRAASNPP